MMIGGYLSFQGIDGRARWRRTPVEDALPVTCLPYDDRIEVPEGFVPEIVGADDHPVLRGLGRDWPLLLGANEVEARTDPAVELLARLPASDFTEESLALVIPENHRRYLRVRIFNRDDQPLHIGPIQFEGLIRQLKFFAPTAGGYWLYYCNTNVSSPQYDLPALLARRKNAEANWTLGAAEANPLYHPPTAPKKPWSEQHPAILYTVLGGAVLTLGIATFRFAARLR